MQDLLSAAKLLVALKKLRKAMAPALTAAQATHGHDAWQHSPLCDKRECVGCGDSASNATKTHGNGGRGHQSDCDDPHCGGSCSGSKLEAPSYGGESNRVWDGAGFLSPQLDAKYSIKATQYGKGPTAEWGLKIGHKTNGSSLGIMLSSMRGGNPNHTVGDLAYGKGISYIRNHDSVDDMERTIDGHRDNVNGKKMRIFNKVHAAELASAAYKLADMVTRGRKDTKFVGFHKPWKQMEDWRNRG